MAWLQEEVLQRGVAQSGSAPALGAGGPRFESGRPDSEEVETPLGLWRPGGVSSFALASGGAAVECCSLLRSPSVLQGTPQDFRVRVLVALQDRLRGLPPPGRLARSSVYVGRAR